jgi:Ser/Thr protein kinase RdoA (MazF antagonist)
MAGAAGGTGFAGLTPDRVLGALEARGLTLTGHCTPLTCLENRVYDVRLEGGSHVVVKFYRPGRWSRDTILEEHRFLFDLQQAEIPVCVPLMLQGESLHASEGLFFAVWPRTGGRSPDEYDDDEVATLGRLLARVHNVGAAREATHRPRLDPGTAAFAPLAELEAGLLPTHLRARFRAAVEAAAGVYATRLSDVPLHRIHGDCHAGNLLYGDSGWFLLDFDDFVVGPAVQDVWMLFPGRDAEGARQRSLAIAAYRELRPFEERWLALVEPLRALRFVFYAAWIARRWQDPAFPAAFPHFGTDAYWEREVLDLEQVLTGEARPTEPGVGAGASEPGEPLSNRDFFWDL